MSNPLSNEREIYEKIQKENITIHPLIWELIDHHIHNDLYMINLILGSTVLDGEQLGKENAEKVVTHSRNIEKFLESLRKAAGPKDA